MPQEEKSIIRSLMDPTIVLDSLELYDLDTGTSEQAQETGREGMIRDEPQHRDIGTNYPFVVINNYTFNKNEILYFEIDYNGFIPTMRMTAAIRSKNWTGASFPKDGDLVNVFIRAKNDAFKPIRNDYRITRIEGAKGGSEGTNAIYEIAGELFIPHMYDEIIQSYNGTSYEVLKQIAKELGLGFASNDTASNDSQIWINPGGDYRNLIKDITTHSWKDETSFFDAFIDIYYHLNFVNVNNQFSENSEVDMQLLVNLRTNDSIGGEKNKQDLESGVAQMPKVLTNWEDARGSAAYIHGLDVKNASNEVNKKMGYKKYSQFFDQKSEEYWSIYAEPITTPGAESNKIILKGRTTKPGSTPEEFWKTQNRYEWAGILYSAPEGNAHEKYNFAKEWNARNIAELKKMSAEVKLERGNFNIYRGERLPIIMFVMSDAQSQIILSPEDADKPNSAYPQPNPDKFLSGYYMVAGMTFSYSARGETNSTDTDEKTPGFTQRMLLTRREWPTPV